MFKNLYFLLWRQWFMIPILFISWFFLLISSPSLFALIHLVPEANAVLSTLQNNGTARREILLFLTKVSFFLQSCQWHVLCNIFSLLVMLPSQYFILAVNRYVVLLIVHRFFSLPKYSFFPLLYSLFISLILILIRSCTLQGVFFNRNWRDLVLYSSFSICLNTNVNAGILTELFSPSVIQVLSWVKEGCQANIACNIQVVMN